MKNELKQKLYNYFNSKESLNEEEQDLFKELETEMQYADIEGMAVCADDIQDKVDSLVEEEGGTLEDGHVKIGFDLLCAIAEHMDDFLQEEFGGAVDYAIERQA